MVDLDTLATFDSLIGLQTGEEVGLPFPFNPLSVSRNQRQCAQAFGVELGNVEALADVPRLALPEGAHPKCSTVWSTAAPATRRSGW